eukprot:2276924-Pleurochrysis_carterae.AAC.1
MCVCVSESECVSERTSSPAAPAPPRARAADSPPRLPPRSAAARAPPAAASISSLPRDPPRSRAAAHLPP